jgi:hypothetical protein
LKKKSACYIIRIGERALIFSLSKEKIEGKSSGEFIIYGTLQDALLNGGGGMISMNEVKYILFI